MKLIVFCLLLATVYVVAARNYGTNAKGTSEFTDSTFTLIVCKQGAACEVAYATPDSPQPTVVRVSKEKLYEFLNTTKKKPLK